MNLFINDAWAQAAPAGSPEPSFLSFVPLILIFVVFYFLLIRPQMKRAKEHRKTVESLSKHDEVVTTGGMLGRIMELEESFIVLEIADGVQIKVQRNSVAQLVPKGTYKSA